MSKAIVSSTLSVNRLVVASLVSIFLAACGGGSEGNGSVQPPGGGGGPPEPSAPSATVTGKASKGLLLNAIVNFHGVTNGVVGTTPLATVRTSPSTGAFSSTISSNGPVVATLTVDGSTLMRDEISGDDIPAPAGLTLHAVFPSLTNLQPLAITPLTELAYQLSIKSPGGLTIASIDAGNSTVSTVFLDGAPVLATQPIDIADYSSATPAQQAQAKLLAALAVAADKGIATGADGQACAQAYPASIPCLVGGLDELVSVTGNTATLGASSAYLAAAYEAINAGAATLDGGKSPEALGMNVPTTAETALVTAIVEQNPLPGYNPGADPLQNTRDLIANLRTNTITQWNADKFGMSSQVDGLVEDFNGTVKPVVTSTGDALGNAFLAALFLAGEVDEMDSCDGWDDDRPANVVTCAYGTEHESAYEEWEGHYSSTARRRQIQLVIEKTGDTTYTLTTQPVETTYFWSMTCDSSCQYEDNQVEVCDDDGCWLDYPTEAIAEKLTAQLVLASNSGVHAVTVNGKLYVTTSGGRVDVDMHAGQASDWDDATGTGTIAASGTLSNGVGGISLVEAAIGDATILHVKNARHADRRVKWSEVTHSYEYECWDEVAQDYTATCTETWTEGDGLLPTIVAGSPQTAAWGVVELTHFRTAGFSYAGKVNVAEPVYDKSGILGVPVSVTATASISEVLGGGVISPLFTGSISGNILGIAGWDATKAFSATNTLTGQVQVVGKLSLPTGRVLDVSATVNAQRWTPYTGDFGDHAEDPEDPFILNPWGIDADHPASFAATYRYVTPSGIAELHAEGTYMRPNGLTGTITNNAGVVIEVSFPVTDPQARWEGAALGKGTATITANGVETATINGDGMVFYSDGSSESLL